jgi:3-hydroxybutyryl-CoA dehydrogenase
MEIREVAVVGLGTMGAGIAEVFARAGLRVVAIEADEAALSRGLSILDGSLGRAVSRGRLTSQEQDEIRGRVTPAGGFDEAAGADLAIEVVPEQLELKRRVFAELDRHCRPDAILATNTSSLSVTDIAAPTRHPGRVVGMHFFNPAPVMRLVEVVGTVLADDGVQAAAADLARRLGKTPVQVGDRAGFVANALLLPYLNHAVTLLETGFASRADIDAAATAGIGLPMGPLALLDLIGLDTSLSIMEVLREEFGGPRYTPAPLLRRLVAAGRTGRKSGRGLHEYAGGKPVSPVRTDIPNKGLTSPPATITLVGSGADGAVQGGRPPYPPRAAWRRQDLEGELGAAAAAAGISITPDPGQPSDLVIVAATPDASVLAAALAAGRPQDTVGLYAGGGRLAELVITRLTSPAAAAAAEALAGQLGLSVVLAPDRPGFLAGTLLYPHLADAVRMVQDGYASAADVDTAMTLGCGYPEGPLELLDQAGPERALAVLSAMYDAYGDPAFAPPPLLAEHAAAGLGFRG